MTIPLRTWSVFGHVLTPRPAPEPEAVWLFTSAAEPDARRLYDSIEPAGELLGVYFFVHKLHDYLAVQLTRKNYTAWRERYGDESSLCPSIDAALMSYFHALHTLLQGGYRCLWEPRCSELNVNPAAVLGIFESKVSPWERHWYCAHSAGRPAELVDAQAAGPASSAELSNPDPYHRPED